MPEKIKLTKKNVESLPSAPTGKQVDYYDSDLPAFGVRVSASTKTYFVRRRVGGKNTRVNIDKHGIITADEARDRARKALVQLGEGNDLNKEKRVKADRGITLQLAYTEYLAKRPGMTDRTKSVDASLLKCHLSDWLAKPILEITEGMIQKKHSQLVKNVGKHSGNNAIRLFRRIYLSLPKAANVDKQLISDAMKNQWSEVERRKTFIQPSQLWAWHQSVQKINGPVVRDYLLLLIHTGLREREGLGLRWVDVDLHNGFFTVQDTKNKSAHTLPISSQVRAIFQSRLDDKENEFVFPGSGETCHLTEPKRALTFVVKESAKFMNGVKTDEALSELTRLRPDEVQPGVKFCLHDLRRTFANVAEELVTYSMLKALLNHNSKKDVTAGYITVTPEKMVAPFQKVCDQLTDFFNTEPQWAPSIHATQETEPEVNTASGRERSNVLAFATKAA